MDVKDINEWVSIMANAGIFSIAFYTFCLDLYQRN